MPKVRFHDLRHSYATGLLDDNAPLVAVSALLGHASANTTLGIYAHATEAGLASTVALRSEQLAVNLAVNPVADDFEVAS